MNTSDDATWTSKDGTVHRIRDMTDRHIINCIRMLRWWELASALGLVSALAQIEAGEALEDQVVDGLADRDPGDIHPTYGALLAEANRRGLEPG